MITHSITQHFSIPGNQNVLVFPVQATNAQRQALDELGYQENASGDAEDRLHVLPNGDVRAAHEAVTQAKAEGAASSLAPNDYVLRQAIASAEAREKFRDKKKSLDTPPIQAKKQNQVSFSAAEPEIVAMSDN